MRLPTGKGNKETGNDHALLVFEMLWNCLKDSTEFYDAGDGYKNRSHSKRKVE